MAALTSQQQADVLLAEWQRHRALPPEQREIVVTELYAQNPRLFFPEDRNVETRIPNRPND
jgi:hypothetical protein